MTYQRNELCRYVERLEDQETKFNETQAKGTNMKSLKGG